MIKAIIFDLDGMVHITEERFSAWATRELNVDKTRLLEFFNTDFKDCLVGKKDLKICLAKVLDECNWHGNEDDLMRHWFEYGRLDMEMVGMIRELRKNGIKCILATNNEKYRMDFFRDTHGFDALFDRIITSVETGICKPKREMFDFILKEACAEKGEILFCDDRVETIRLAGEYGFEDLLYMDLDSFRQELSRLQVI